MASKVRAQDVNEEVAAEYKLEISQEERFCSPVREVMNPTTPAISENIMNIPVAAFPIGKYIGNN